MADSLKLLFQIVSKRLFSIYILHMSTLKGKGLFQGVIVVKMTCLRFRPAFLSTRRKSIRFWTTGGRISDTMRDKNRVQKCDGRVTCLHTLLSLPLVTSNYVFSTHLTRICQRAQWEQKMIRLIGTQNKVVLKKGFRSSFVEHPAINRPFFREQ